MRAPVSAGCARTGGVALSTPESPAESWKRIVGREPARSATGELGWAENAAGAARRSGSRARARRRAERASPPGEGCYLEELRSCCDVYSLDRSACHREISTGSLARRSSV